MINSLNLSLLLVLCSSMNALHASGGGVRNRQAVQSEAQAEQGDTTTYVFSTEEKAALQKYIENDGATIEKKDVGILLRVLKTLKEQGADERKQHLAKMMVLSLLVSSAWVISDWSSDQWMFTVKKLGIPLALLYIIEEILPLFYK